MLQLILGRSGFGKTHIVRQIIADKARAGHDQLMLIVPEQYSFENERAMLNVLGRKFSTTLQIMSFTRLCEAVYRKVGGVTGEYLDDGGRNVIMSLAIEQVKTKLVLYRRQAEKIEFVQMMIEAYKEFKACDVCLHQMCDITEKIVDVITRQKLNETSIILSAYEAIMQQSYLDPVDDLTRLYDTLLENDFFSGYTVVVDEFFGFTVQEMKILEQIIVQADECYITMCTEPESLAKISPGLDIFSIVDETSRRILRIAQNNNVLIKPPIALEKAHRFCSTELVWLESNFFRAEKVRFSGDVQNMMVYEADDLYDESDFVARTIRKLVMENNICYGDFVVITRDVALYKEIIDIAFAKYDIPCFVDKRESINSEPLVNLILAALDVVTHRFRSEHVLRYMKTRLLPCSIEEVSTLENYVLLWNIKGRDWFSDFTANPYGFKANSEEEQVKQKLCSINKIRECIVEPLVHFAENVKNSTGTEISRAVYNLLIESGAQQVLLGMLDKMEVSEKVLFSNETLRVWDVLMHVLEQIALIIKDAPVSIVRFRELFKLAVSSNDIAFIPPGIDQVKIGDADRMRPHHPRVVFVIGTTQGEFPRIPESMGVFSAEQRDTLINSGLPLYYSLEKMAMEERFIAYNAITATSEKLYVSWPKTNSSGVPRQESSIVQDIKFIFPQMHVKNSSQVSIDEKVLSEAVAFETYTNSWDNKSASFNALKQYFTGAEVYTNKLELIQDSLNSESLLTLQSDESITGLFGKNMKISASQVERFHLCRFQYFCKYGVRAKPRRPATLDSIEYGSLMHFILEKVLSKCNNKEDANKEIERSLAEYLQTRMGGTSGKSARFMYLFSQLSVTSKELVSHILSELSQSEFVPTDYELAIGEKGKLPPFTLRIPTGEIVQVEGKVDRVDVMKKNGISYVRIVDYKTGTKSFKLSDVMYGVNTQMLIYLSSIIENGQQKYGNMKPAGILYMPTTLSLSNIERGDDKQIDFTEQRKRYRMNGLIIDDPDVIRGMEKDAKGVFIPVTMKNGKVSKTESLISMCEMGEVLKKISELIILMVRTLHKGKVAPNPLTEINCNACEYCEFSTVCGIEK